MGEPRRTTAFDDLEAFGDFAPGRGADIDAGEGDAEFSGQPRARPAGETFPCQSCGGTGRWRRGANQHGDSRCFACKGAGHFKTSANHRAKAKASRRAHKAKVAEMAQGAFEAQHPGLIARLREIASWHQFAASLVASFDRWHGLTDNQAAAAYRSLEKGAEGRQNVAAKRAAASGDVDASAIQAMFDRASASGLKRPSFEAAGIEFSKASDTGRNPGAIYVKVRGDYAGKIVSGRFLAVSAAPSGTLDMVRGIAADPRGEAVKYGRMTGRCSCCSRKLTDPASVAAGIGPICATNWGL